MRCVLRASALALLPLTVVSGCQPNAGNESVNDETANRVSPLPRLPVVEPPIDRAALLKAVADAASSAALGRDDASEQRPLDGKRFEVRIRFGCAPADPGLSEPGTAQPKSNAPKAAPFKVQFNDKDRTLRVSAAPDLSLSDPTVAQLAGEGVEAVEGFWMNRPWLLSDGCAVQTASPAQTKTEPVASKDKDQETQPELMGSANSGQRVGLAQFFTIADSRTQRRDHRAYEATKVLKEGELPSPQGYNLVMSGRLRQLQGAKVIACRTLNLNSPPECVVSAEFDRVWMENPTSRDVIAEWGN